MTAISVPPDANLRSGPQGREYDQVADRVAAGRPRRVLDWGCGYGQMSARLRARGLDVTSYEYLPDRPPGRFRLAHFPWIEADHGGDPVALPYEDQTFDAVLSCGVLEHVSDPDGSLDELYRVLVPGGMLYVFKLPNERSYLEAIARRAGLYYHGKLADDRLYSPASARALIQRHGFEVDQVRLANMLPLTTWRRQRLTEPIWRANRLLSRLPGVQRWATNVEAIARRPT
jgi:ubiquinone/menaquinone biosynthesis C-methylase UbiE